MKESNYEITKRETARRFLEYDQEKMIEKYHLDYDGDYLYLFFLGKPYRIGRKDGLAERCEGQAGQAVEADFNEAMSIYDVLCYAREDCTLSGVFCLTDSLEGTVRTGTFQPGSGFFREEKLLFDRNTELLGEACRLLGGVPEGRGDAAYRIPVFPFLPVRLQFWNSDEDFEAELQFLWDRNVLQYLHYETLWYVMCHLVQELKSFIINKRD
jgi:hypothetical protein